MARRASTPAAPPRPLLAGSYDEEALALSPDGRWLAYVSSETGRREVFVRPFPEVDSGKWQVSTTGGLSPAWAHSGRELFFVDGNGDLVSQAVQPGESFTRGGQRVLFSMAGYREVGNYQHFDVAPDDQRFLMVRTRRRAETEAQVLVVVENWLEEVDGIIEGR
ncbi:MAG TPA: LpqB family beta-propeller domain-containing protein [Longimicrobiales bacterium]|nr:LpqB family beta-propeller domain-containing protein [Longimicrobiales bacterium]